MRLHWLVAFGVAPWAWACGASATAPAQDPPPASPPAAVVTVAAQRPSSEGPPSSEPDEPARVEAPRSRPSGPPTGIVACDAYLDLYEACEPRLRGEIQAGERRTPQAERAWILYIMSTPERASLDQGCLDMLAMIRDRCR